MDQNGTSYSINIGTEKACLFIGMSRHLVNVLKKNPFLYFAVEESLLSAKQGWYSIGIIAYAQILNTLNQKTPQKRHEIAHRILRMQPSKSDYEAVLDKLKKAAQERCVAEFSKAKDKEKYREELLAEWKAWVSGL